MALLAAGERLPQQKPTAQIGSATVKHSSATKAMPEQQLYMDVSGNEAGAALLMLSQLANTIDAVDGTPRRASQEGSGLAMSPCPMSPQLGGQHPHRKFNVVALIMHLQALEERVKQLESLLIQGTSQLHQRHNQTCDSAGICPSECSTSTRSPSLVSPTMSVPPSLTSIKFTSGAPAASPVLASVPSYIVSPAGTTASIQSPPSQPMWTGPVNMVLKDATVKDVQRSALDRVCLPILEICYDPDKTQLMDAVDELERYLHHIDRRILMSAVRKWFRKRREEMGARIFLICKGNEAFNALPPEQVPAFLQQLKANHALLDSMRLRASIEIKNLDQARQFCCEKIDSYFRRRIMG